MLMYGWWGFDSIRSWLSACQRRVVPLMVRFPRLAAVRPQCEVVCCPNCRPPRRKTLKMGRSGRGGLRFGQSGVWCGVRARRGPGSWTLLLAVLTLQCAAKPYGWHGGQPAQVPT